MKIKVIISPQPHYVNNLCFIRREKKTSNEMLLWNDFRSRAVYLNYFLPSFSLSTWYLYFGFLSSIAVKMKKRLLNYFFCFIFFTFVIFCLDWVSVELFGCGTFKASFLDDLNTNLQHQNCFSSEIQTQKSKKPQQTCLRLKNSFHAILFSFTFTFVCSSVC
jgi:hypothetical protein